MQFYEGAQSCSKWNQQIQLRYKNIFHSKSAFFNVTNADTLF